MSWTEYILSEIRKKELALAEKRGMGKKQAADHVDQLIEKVSHEYHDKK